MKKLEKRVSAVLVAAGSSTRMGFDKLSFDLGGETVLHRSIRAFEQDPLVTEIVLVAGKNRAFVEQQAADCTKPVQIVTGGTTRAESAKNGVLAAAGELVAVHDAARPFVSQAVITAALEAAARCGAAAPAVPVKDTIKAAARGNGKTVRMPALCTQRPTAAPCMRCRPLSALTAQSTLLRWKSWMPKSPPCHRRLQPVRADRPRRAADAGRLRQL